MSELVFEIGCEEMPSQFVQPAIEQLAELGRVKLLEEQLINVADSRGIKSYGTPCRLVLIVNNLVDKQPDIKKKILGPFIKQAYNEKGESTDKLLGFLFSHNIKNSELEKFSTNRGIRIGFFKNISGDKACKILSKVLPNLVQSIYFTKTMRWGGSGKVRFIRPIHWFLALLDNQLISFELAGVKSNCYTYGHRFMCSDPIFIRHANNYLKLISIDLAFIEIDRNKRKKRLFREIDKLARSLGSQVIQTSGEEKDIIAKLIEEVTDIIEIPVPCHGFFNREFLKLPKSVIITVMCEHQRYFPLEDYNGKLVPIFIAINNTRVNDIALVIQGHERVLQARLSDACFFLEADIKQPLIDYLEDLKNVTYHVKIGTYYDKVNRLIILATWLSEQIAPELVKKVERAVKLSKCDLVTYMVKEFSSLQGKIGEYYAFHYGEDYEICVAIREHYKPISAYDGIPSSFIGALIGIADRLDSICGLFGIGEIPTGTSDPYALRRAVFAVIRIIIEKKIIISLYKILDLTFDGLYNLLNDQVDKVKARVIDFFTGRMVSFLIEQGISFDIAEAVVAVGVDDLMGIYNRAFALTELKKTSNYFSLFFSIKRVINILRKESENIIKIQVDPILFEFKEEYELYITQQTIKNNFQNCYLDYNKSLLFLQELLKLNDPINNFFGSVKVMVEDQVIRNNRLALLSEIYILLKLFADFSLLKNF